MAQISVEFPAWKFSLFNEIFSPLFLLFSFLRFRIDDNLRCIILFFFSISILFLFVFAVIFLRYDKKKYSKWTRKKCVKENNKNICFF